ncbi:hypothetical protein VP01_3807g1 [Puccinia sorghi]|uniref:Uncharacterized protein n=1 Tax=Puccinia sorghi TaxID=27349 RepID=A0A0L6UV90_9BASI|nr:hypothetical protein VP01_3807g1 [Puccinia sorghi]
MQNAGDYAKSPSAQTTRRRFCIIASITKGMLVIFWDQVLMCACTACHVTSRFQLQQFCTVVLFQGHLCPFRGWISISDTKFYHNSSGTQGGFNGTCDPKSGAQVMKMFNFTPLSHFTSYLYQLHSSEFTLVIYSVAMIIFSFPLISNVISRYFPDILMIYPSLSLAEGGGTRTRHLSRREFTNKMIKMREIKKDRRKMIREEGKLEGKVFSCELFCENYQINPSRRTEFLKFKFDHHRNKSLCARSFYVRSHLISNNKSFSWFDAQCRKKNKIKSLRNFNRTIESLLTQLNPQSIQMIVRNPKIPLMFLYSDSLPKFDSQQFHMMERVLMSLPVSLILPYIINNYINQRSEYYAAFIHVVIFLRALIFSSSGAKITHPLFIKSKRTQNHTASCSFSNSICTHYAHFLNSSICQYLPIIRLISPPYPTCDPYPT